MARAEQRIPQNAAGEFFVDRSCIDCDTCRQLASSVFDRSDEVGQSYVRRQPGSEEEALRAAMALVSCPVSAIGTVHKADSSAGVGALPEPLTPDVAYCGFASERSYGASSYFIRREEGNVLVDSPRAAGPLLKRLEALGGVSLMFLSHRDDVADHERFHAHFGCRRVLHAEDVDGRTREVELRIQGRDPVELGGELVVIPVPGHTRGSAALLYKRRYLFTGDHLWGADDGSGLEAGRGVCWYSWEEQTRSMERLLDFEFEWVLPGHGQRFRAPSVQAMRGELERLIRRMRRAR